MNVYTWAALTFNLILFAVVLGWALGKIHRQLDEIISYNRRQDRRLRAIEDREKYNRKEARRERARQRMEQRAGKGIESLDVPPPEVVDKPGDPTDYLNDFPD